MNSIPLNQITNNLDSKRIPLNSTERAKLTKAKLYPYIGANNVLEYIDDYIFDEKILCISEDGGSWGANEVCAKIYNERCWVNNHAHVLTAKCGTILEYLAAYLNYADLNPYITGTTRGKLTRNKLDSITIPLPPLDDQKRIAHLLGKVEGLIARRKHHQQQLDELIKSVFLEMFGDPESMKRQLHFSLGVFMEFLTSGSRGWAKYYSESGSVFIRINNVKDASLKLDDIVYVKAPDSAEANRTRVKHGDLLLSITADLGRTAVVPKELEGSYINQHLALIRLCPDCGLHPLFLAWYFTLPYGNSFVQKKNREGVKAGLNFDDIRGLQVVKPPVGLQNRFASIVAKVEGLNSRYQQSLTDLESLYGALSQKAFKGELDLSRVPLPPEGPQISDEEMTDVEEKQPMKPLFELPAPAEITAFRTAEGRKSLLGEWLNAWLKHLGNTPFSAQEFMEAAQQRSGELMEDDAPNWGAAEYDALKDWVFAALEEGRLTQGYDDASNRVQITAEKG